MLAGLLVGTGGSFLAAAPLPSPAAAQAALAQIDELQAVDPERALDLAVRLRTDAPDEPAQLAADLRIAQLRRLLTDYTAAHELAQAGLARATARQDLKLVAGFRYVLARTQWSLGNYPAALELYLQSLKEAETAGDLGTAFDAHSGISTIFSDFKQPDQALYHLEQGRKIAEELKDMVRLGDWHKIVGNNAINRGDFARARDEHAESLRIHRQAGSERGVADALQNLGRAYELLGDHARGEDLTRQSIAIYRRLGLRRQLVNALRQSGRILVKEGSVDEGVKELEETLALSQELKARSLIAYACRELVQAYEKQGNLRAAFDAQRKLIATNEAVFSERATQQLAILNSRYQAERRELEIDLLRRDQALKDAALARSRAERYWLLAVAGIGVIALAAIISRQRLKLKAEQRVSAQLRAAQRAAEQADRLKTRLLSIASHDLKNPLGAVMGGLEELRDTVPQERGFIDDLLAESRRMLELIRDLLDHAALESGQLTLNRRPMNAGALAGEVVAAHQSRAAAKEIRLAFNSGGAVPAIEADPIRLRQVLVNLVDNALKFTPRGGAVTVGLQVADGEVRLAIADTGPGLPPEDLGRLFTPYASLSARPTGGESSTGLGLSICQEIVTLHGGRIEVQSAPGKGSTFTVIFPTGVPAPVV